jgi:hypothetical protein
MDRVRLTTDEKEQLRKTIEQAEIFKNKKLKELTLLVTGAIAVGLIATYRTGNFSSTSFLVALILGLAMMMVFSIGWYLAGQPIKKMEMDLKSGIKRTGTSEISRINIFNRTIKLVDGMTVYENDFLSGKWKKGDKIFYQTTISGQHLFECKRVE